MDSMDHGGIKWGAEIEINRERPDWIEDHDIFCVKSVYGRWYNHRDVREYLNGFNMVDAIKLPADHPQYQKQAEAPAIDPALVARMRKLVENMANDYYDLPKATANEARDILKALEPVDPDVAIAEEIAASFNEGDYEAIALAALKRGRQLEREKIA